MSFGPVAEVDAEGEPSQKFIFLLTLNSQILGSSEYKVVIWVTEMYGMGTQSWEASIELRHSASCQAQSAMSL